METVSIIIPAYNAAATLHATIASCFQQIMPPCEIIVINDGSKDATEKIATSFGDRVRYFCLENGGVSRARNYGAAQAHGTWLLFLDADDQLLPHATKVLLEKALAQNAGVAYGMVIERRENRYATRLNGFDYAAGLPPKGAKNIFWRNAIITPGSAVVRAALHQKIGGFVSGYEPMEDRDYWIKCGLLETIAFCDMVVLDKIWQPESHGSQHSKRIYRGQLALRALKPWAAEQKVPSDWMPSDRAIVKSALDEALWRRCDSILETLLEAAKGLGMGCWKERAFSTFLKMVSQNKEKEMNKDERNEKQLSRC